MKKRTMIVPLHQKHIYQVQCSNVNKLVRRKERKKNWRTRRDSHTRKIFVDVGWCSASRR
jgi:hypothetical protein